MSGKNGGTVVAISSSPGRGTQKSNVPSGVLVENWGLEGDAHAGAWHRQVSLLAVESIAKIRALGADVGPGDFAENITTSGVDLPACRVGDRLLVGDAELEVTQIGKECHARCAIFQAVGDCVMPREGIFARVIRGGTIYPGAQVCRVTAAAPAETTATP